MNKVPVFQTLGEAFEFAFDHYLPNFGVVWLPMLLLFGADYFFLAPILKMLPGIVQFKLAHPHEFPFSQFVEIRATLFVLQILSYVIFAWISVGITKEALGMRHGFRPVYIPTGLPELRVLGAYFLVFVMAIAAGIAIFIAVAIAGGTIAAFAYNGAFHGMNGSAVLGWTLLGIAFAYVFVIWFFIYFGLRLMFLLVPATVAEGRFGLWRSWELSSGNVWRLFAIMFMLVLLVMALEIMVSGLVLFPAIGSVIAAFPHPKPADAVAIVNGILAALRPWALIGVLVVLAVLPMIYGLILGASASAYRALVPERAM